VPDCSSPAGRTHGRHAIELLDEVEIATELEHWMLADRMMRSEERAET